MLEDTNSLDGAQLALLIWTLLHLHLQVMPVWYGYASFEADYEVTCEDTKQRFLQRYDK